jgi:hypothetical protein
VKVKIIAKVPFDRNGIPNFPMEILGGSEGYGYSRIGQVPKCADNLVAIRTSTDVYNALAVMEGVVISESYNDEVPIRDGGGPIIEQDETVMADLCTQVGVSLIEYYTALEEL